MLTISHSYSWSLFGKSSLEKCADEKYSSIIYNTYGDKFLPINDDDDIKKRDEWYSFCKNTHQEHIWHLQAGSILPSVDAVDYRMNCSIDFSVTNQFYAEDIDWISYLSKEDYDGDRSREGVIDWEWKKYKSIASGIDKFVSNAIDKNLNSKMNEVSMYDTHFKACEKDKSEFPITFNEKYN